ncbi:Aminopeptidase, partial [hydrothermal vent metagenome]
MFKNILAIYVALVLFIGVSGNTMAKDAHSYANLEEVSSRHLHLDLTVDFDKKTLSGYAEYDIVRHSAAASSFIVDTRDLTINRVEVLGEDWQPTTFTLAAPEAVLGAKLTIALPDNAQKVRIYYRTSPDAAGLQWLTPQQTAGNTGIYGEKYILEAAAAEFADTYEMVKVAEKLYG